MRLLTEWAFNISGWIVYWGGYSMRKLMGIFLGLLWFDVFRIRRKVALENLERAFPEKSLAERTRIARASLFHMGICIVEYGWLTQLNRSNYKSICEIKGREKVEAALGKEKGVLFLAAHIGNGDVASAVLSLDGLPIYLVSKQFNSKWLNEAWFNIRRRLGTKFISPEKSSFEVLRALKRNEIVVFVLDQFMGPPVGVETKFFGHRTGTAAGLATIANRSEAPVIPVITYRRDDGSHLVSFGDEIPFVSTEGQERNPRDIQVMTQKYTDKIEEIVRLKPEQWMWIHRRWKEFEVR